MLNWDIAQLDNDSLWSVVELPWEYENGKVTMSIPEVKSYAENNNVDFKPILRLVILKNKQTGETYGFKMAVIPELNYMLSKGGDVSSNDYFDRDANFSGLIMYYSIDDKFVNGWQYSKGKITGALKQTNPKANRKALKSEYRIDIMEVQVCGYYYSDYAGVRYYGVDCYSRYYHLNVISSDYFEDGGSGGNFYGSFDTDSGGGETGNTQTPTTSTECDGEKCPTCGGIVSWDFSDETGQLNVKSTNPACPKCTCKRDYPKSKECLAYADMYKDALANKNEYCALLTTRGVHSWKTESPKEGLGFGPFSPKWDNAMHLWYIGSADNKEYIVGVAHVHWEEFEENFSGIGGDFSFAQTLHAPLFLFTADGKVKACYSADGKITNYIDGFANKFTVSGITNCTNSQSLLNYCSK